MRILSVMSHKGGSGKTTLTTNLAVCALHDGLNVGIIDLDPQGSSQLWCTQRDKQPGLDHHLSYSLAATSFQLSGALSNCQAKGIDLVIVDTPPRMDNGAAAVASLSDFILVPTRPSTIDTHANIDNIHQAEHLNKHACIVLNGVPAIGTSGESFARTIQSDLEFPVAPEFLAHRVPYQRAVSAGLGVIELKRALKASQEMERLWRWVCPFLHRSQLDPSGGIRP